MKKLDLEWLQNNEQYILFESVSGSHAYGTNTETSDRDVRGVFCVPQQELYGLEIPDQVSDEKNDIVYYELGKFCEMLLKSNPTILELLNMPEDCILYVDPLFKKYFIKKRQSFITKMIYKAFLEYANGQITKAKGLNKMMNLEKQAITRKTVFDFCYVPHGQGSCTVNKWLKDNKYTQDQCGLVKIPHMRETYSLFIGEGYKGIFKNENSNDILLSSIKKGEVPATIMVFAKDEYSIHCKKYKEYTDWLKNRNTQRYVDVEGHGQQIDGKNMLHCVRLIETCEDIIKYGEIIIRRPNAEYLLDIRRGKVDLDTLIENSTNKLAELKVLFEESGLPDSIDRDTVNTLLKKIRTKFYKKYE